ncbi:hypothetical protein Bca4012_068256 [Brassica carinata]|uniref:Uncharacterized protein n=1 Tax=Brassica carinata TaxID=52824 RepID=A0A8X7VTT0_BRACI|nr:hypothetical protein Bca52824_020481 [Brassica carinata]
MKGFNTPQKSQGRDLFYQTPSPTNFSEEEIQRNIEFLKKLQEADDKTLYRRYQGMMQRYLSGCITYIQLKRGLVIMLRRHRGLFKEFRQLLLYFDSPPVRKDNPKAELERTVAFLHKIEALGESVYKAFIGALGSSGDNEVLIEQLGEMLRGDESLKEEFETFLIDNRLLKRKRDNVSDTPSYWIRPEVEKGSGSAAVSHGEYYSVGSCDPKEAVEKNSEPCRDEKGNRLAAMLLDDLDSFLEFEKATEDDLRNRKPREMPPVGLSRVLEWLCNGKKVPPEFK